MLNLKMVNINIDMEDDAAYREAKILALKQSITTKQFIISAIYEKVKRDSKKYSE